MRARARNGRALRSRSTKGPNFHLDFVDVGVDCTDNFFRKKAIEKTILRILRPSAFSHSLGQKRKCPGPCGTSVLPSGADIVSLPRHVRLVTTHKAPAPPPPAPEQKPSGRSPT